MKTIPDSLETVTIPDSTGRLRAVIVYRHTDLLPHAYRWCEEHGFEVVYLVPRQRSADALHLLDDGAADIITTAPEPPSDDPAQT